MLHHIALLLAAVLLITSNASAQSKSNKITLRLVAERVPADLGKVHLLYGEKNGEKKGEAKKSEAFDLPDQNLSPEIPIEARAATLHTAKDTRIATLTIPEVGNDFIALLVPDPKGGYKAVLIPAKDPSFAPGDSFFYNHSRLTIIGYVGKSKFILPPKKSHILRPTAPRKEGFYDVGFGIREEGKEDRALHNTRWPVEKNIRSYIFFYTNPNNNSATFRAVDEFVAPPKK